MTARRAVVLHAHLYQPPRENPWTGAIEVEPTAAPDHDWNARIARECYAPLAAIPVGEGQDAPRVNAYDWLSFDVGPTLLPWLERETPDVYRAMLDGDRSARTRVGRGNAMAMPYHHVILPLCSRRDKRSEVRWGIADFRRRFGRDPEGLWLPETAVDGETLDVLAEEGIAFTVLAPHQVQGAPASGLAGRVRTPGGRSIAVFAYDGQLAHGVAFGDLLRDSAAWERAVVNAPAARVVSLATDGETYGHHHHFGDLGLGALLHRLAARPDVRVENFASVLAAHPAATDVTLVEPTSWSCAHGVERWRSDCGCRMTLDGSTQQRWRTPLREAIDWLVAEIHEIADAGGQRASADGEDLPPMVRSALAAQTSCGWFFDDFGALEGRQVLRFAAHAIAQAGEDGPRLEDGLVARLASAESNDPSIGSAARFYFDTISPDRLAT